MSTTPPSPVNTSAAHVFQVLRLVAEADEPLGASEISRRLGLPASTVYRALITLEESDHIIRSQNMPRYELGPMPQLLNRALMHRFRLYASSRPVLRELAESTGETVSLTVALGWYGLRLAGVYGSRDIYHRKRLGEVKPLHETLSGRSMLASAPPSELERYGRFVQTHHGHGLDWAGLRRSLDQARSDGFAWKEVSGGLAALALPVRDAAGEALAALTISGPVFRPDEGEPLQDALAARAALEAQVTAAPNESISPFSHIPKDEIVIRCPRLHADDGTDA